jgi:hypothetical protein
VAEWNKRKDLEQFRKKDVKNEQKDQAGRINKTANVHAT